MSTANPAVVTIPIDSMLFSIHVSDLVIATIVVAATLYVLTILEVMITAPMVWWMVGIGIAAFIVRTMLLRFGIIQKASTKINAA
jgi:hypothetical protein